MFGWIRNWNRKRILRKPLPSHWANTLRNNAVFFGQFEQDIASGLLGVARVLVAEKNWEGCGGLEISDEHKATVALQIARISAGWIREGRKPEYFDEVRSILVYPDAYLAKTQQNMGSGVVMETQSGRLGEAWYRGPVILSWSDVLETARNESFARNVVVHEFVHHLDMRNGSQPDGVPVIESRDFASRWLQVLRRDFASLQARCRQGLPGVMDCYGATSPSEFFAVACEVFFEAPHSLRQEFPETYRNLSEFFSLAD